MLINYICICMFAALFSQLRTLHDCTKRVANWHVTCNSQAHVELNSDSSTNPNLVAPVPPRLVRSMRRCLDASMLGCVDASMRRSAIPSRPCQSPQSSRHSRNSHPHTHYPSRPHLLQLSSTRDCCCSGSPRHMHTCIHTHTRRNACFASGMPASMPCNPPSYLGRRAGTTARDRLSNCYLPPPSQSISSKATPACEPCAKHMHPCV